MTFDKEFEPNLKAIRADDFENEPKNAKEIMDKFFETWNSNAGYTWRPRNHYVMLPSMPAVKVISADEILEGFE